MRIVQRGSILILCFLATEAFSIRAMAAPLPTFPEIISLQEAQNEKITVLCLEGNTHEYLWKSDRSSWELTPVTLAFRLAFENKEKGRYVLNSDPAINRWTHGAAPYGVSWTTEFRQADGFIVNWSKAFQSHDGTKFLHNKFERDEISKRMEGPNERSYPDGFVSGRAFTALGAIGNFDRTPLELLVKDTQFKISQTAEGFVQIDRAWPDIGERFEVVVDPSKDYSLVRYTRIHDWKEGHLTNGWVTTSEVLEKRKLGNGVWYPVRCAVTNRYVKEFADHLRQRNPRSEVGDDDPFADRKREMIYTNIEIPEADNREAVLSVQLPVEVPVREQLSAYATADALWTHIRELDKTIMVAPDGRRRSDKELKTAREQLDAAVTNFLDRFPDNPRKWEAKWLQASNTSDYKKGEMVTKELVTSADVPPEIRKSAGEQLLMRFIIGKGQSGEPVVDSYCRDYPGPICDEFRFQCAQWLLYYRKDPSKAVSILTDLAEHGGSGIAQRAKDFLAKKDEILKAAEETDRKSAEKRAADAVEHAAAMREIIGKPFVLNTAGIDGAVIDASKFRGKVLLVDFWATWCGPCNESIPHLIATYQKYHERGLEIIGVSNDLKDETVQKFVAEKGMPWPQCVDKTGIIGLYKVSGLPTFLLINKKGSIVKNAADDWFAAKSNAERIEKFDADVEKLLAED
jgi:thiol-disulfide isomerase/thioredoxin